MTRYQGIHGCAESIDISAGIGSRAILFRCSIAGRTMAKRCRGAIRVVLLSDAKIDQDCLITCCGQDDVGWLDVAVNDRWLLAMQVGQGIDDWRYNDENLVQRKALFWPLPSQDFQVRAFNILH